MRLRRAFTAVLIVVPLTCCVPSAQRTQAADPEATAAPIARHWAHTERTVLRTNNTPGHSANPAARASAPT